MTPIQADKVDRTIGAEGGEVAKSLAEKGGEFGRVHLARRHRKGAMMDRAEAARVTVNRNIIRRVGEHHRGALLLY